MSDDRREYMYYAGHLTVRDIRENFVHVSLTGTTLNTMAKMNRTDIAKCIDTLLGVWLDMGRELRHNLRENFRKGTGMLRIRDCLEQVEKGEMELTPELVEELRTHNPDSFLGMDQNGKLYVIEDSEHNRTLLSSGPPSNWSAPDGVGRDSVPEPPEHDDRARCTACGCVISDAEHTDNGGKCEECASFIFAGSTPPARKELPAGDISVKPSRETCTSCGNDIPEADRDIYNGWCKDCHDVKGGPDD